MHQIPVGVNVTYLAVTITLLSKCIHTFVVYYRLLATNFDEIFSSIVEKKIKMEEVRQDNPVEDSASQVH